MPADAFTAAEFFAGIGLVRLALERQGWRVVFANDIDPKKAEMYRRNWPHDDHLLVGNVHTIAADDVPDCSLATASFPCNDLSLAGRWEGLHGKHSSAFWGLVRVLGEMGDRRPRLVMLENVVGFLISRGGRDLEAAMLALNELGYAVDAVILNAAHWTPQSRQRLFVLGNRGEGEESRSYALACDARPEALRAFINAHANIRWSLRDVPPLPRGASRLADILEDLPEDDPHWWNEERTEYLMKQMSPRHAASAREMIAGDSISYATAFRRVPREEHGGAAPRTGLRDVCVRRGAAAGDRFFFGRAGEDAASALLTAREAARLQGAPDDYVIDVPLNQALFGFGDAVCVPAVEWVVRDWLTPAATETSR